MLPSAGETGVAADIPLATIGRPWPDGQMAINGHFGHIRAIKAIMAIVAIMAIMATTAIKAIRAERAESFKSRT